METNNTITGTKPEDRMVLTMTPLEVEAIGLALMLALDEMKSANGMAIKNFETLEPGSEEQHKACSCLMKYLVYQHIMESAMDCINDFHEKQEAAL